MMSTKQEGMGTDPQNAPADHKTESQPSPSDEGGLVRGAKQYDQIKQYSQNADDEPASSKDTLSQQDIADGVKTFEPGQEQHMALETKEGKNNGAIPKAFEHQRSNHP